MNLFASNLKGLTTGFAVLLFTASLSAQPAADGEIAIPPLNARVTDLTGTLSQGDIQSLTSRLAALENTKGSQVAVLIVPTTGPETIEGYSIRVVEKWKLGRQNVDDGVLLIVAKDDRKLRIEVGYGLEGSIPDAKANRIIDEFIVPAFKQGDFAGGINAGVDRIAGLIEGEDLPAPEPRSSGSSGGSDFPWQFLFFGTLFGGYALRGIFGRMIGAGIAAFIGFLLGWFFISLSMGLIGGFVLFIWLLVSGSGGGYAGGYSGGGGGFSSGGGFGGGFSGGGGGFGGGGASGSW